MQEVDGALAFIGRMFFTQSIRKAQCVRPLDRHMHKQTVSQIFFDLPKCGRAFSFRQVAASGRISERIADLDAVQWGVGKRQGIPSQERDGRLVA
jgi:hypothetical protein